SWIRDRGRRRVHRDGRAVPIGVAMLKPLLNVIFGSRHVRAVKRIQPIVDAINVEYERLHDVSEAELKAQSEKLRGIVRERTADLDRQVADLKERERIDNELSGADGRGGVEGELRETIADVLDELLPEAFATVREAARRLLGTTAQ